MKLLMLLALSTCLFLNTQAANTPGLSYNYYEGTWNNLPDFNTLTPVKKGTAANVSLTNRSREGQYAFIWQGFINIPATGNYTFETFSDDGSRLYIGNYGYNTTPVVNNDGEHASQFATGSIALNAGVYPISISFFQNSGGQTMEIYWSSNTGIQRQKIADNVFTLTNTSTPPPVVTAPSAGKSSSDGLKSATNSNYYLSSLSGNDAYTPAQAQNQATPWKTIKKLNEFMSALQPGDAILFKRGEVFDGMITLKQSGTASLPIIFSAYGTGVKPVVNALSTLKNWVSAGNGVWEASCNSGNYLNMVVFNGLVQGMGRYPNITAANRGYLTVDAHSGTSQITDNDPGTSTNWKGAEIVVRKNDWVLDRATVTNHSGNTLDYVSPTPHEPHDGYGYFIQNSPLTLDQMGEWYYNPATKKLKVFFGADNPASYSVKASIVDTLVFTNNKNYTTFDNICFRGADIEALRITNSSNIRIQNSEINYSGLDGISAEYAAYLTIENNNINHSNNSGIRVYEGSSYVTIKNNAIRNSGLIPGMGTSHNQQYNGIFVDATPSNLIEYNTIDSSGYCGITFTGDLITVKNNVINYFCLTVNDGGGIYTWGGWDKTGRKIIGNVVLNGMGAPEGTSSPVPNGAVGIYTDDRSTNVDITDNTVFNCNRAGLFLHNSHEMNITGNTLYNNGAQITMIHDALEVNDPIRNMVTKNNILASSKSTQFLIENVTMRNDIAEFGTYNNNFYLRPTDENGIILTTAMENGSYKSTYFDLASWSAKFGYDQQSTKSPLKIPAYTVNKLIGDNKYPNGNFNTNIDGVVCMSSPGRATATHNTNGKLDGGSLQVSFDASSGATNDVGTYIDFGAVTAGKSYLIKFSLLSANAGITTKSYIMQNGGNYNKLSDIRYFPLSATRSENQFLFTAASTESHAMIAFETGGMDCPFWIDNFQVFEAQVTAVNPQDYMRFEYNATAKPKTLALNGNYVDAANKAYSGNITIKAFSSVILIKQTTVTTATQASTQPEANQMATAAITADKFSQEATAITIKVSPNPAREKLQVAVNLPFGTKTASLSVFSLAGVKLTTLPLSLSATSVSLDVSSLISGVYIITINYDGKLITKKFVKQS